MFKELRKGTTAEVEATFSKEWEAEDLLEQTIDHRKDGKKFVFYDGPATANGMPGIHHMLGKELKDAICKYKTMQGYQVYRKIGWDTHGLPVETGVEKKLGFNGKPDIEKYGIEAFNKQCKESVLENKDAFDNLTKQMGQLIDTKHPYITYDNNYIETEWWILKKIFDDGYFYEGHKVMPYCPHCGTGLASHEVAQGYESVTVNSVIVPMKIVNDDTYFLVWTTTPWTLIANVAICVNPDEKYIKVESQGYKFILAKKLANKVLGDDYKTLETYTGKDLEYTKYEQLMPFIKPQKEAFYVTCDNYVTMEDGTGVVHLAPAFGVDDYNVGKKYDLPVLNPVGLDGKYLEGPWKGKFVFDCDLDVIKYLKENDKLFKKIKLVHNYPFCWRCHTPLIYYARSSYYIATTKMKDQIIANNKTVNWHPAYIGEKRFANWLDNMVDWAISRERYWGTPLPLWTCDCGHKEMLGSREELIEKAEQKVDMSIDLHRPFVDDITIKCPKCGKHMHRTPAVIDCWFDSGSMPFAQYHYPFENKELFASQFPADFIAEGVDQTRGWFYSLLVVSTFVKGVAPYRNVLVNDLLLAANGEKMHKSRGNVVEPFTTIKEYGADTIRCYMPYVSPVWTPIKFDTEGLKEIYSKYISTLKNTYSFFEMYANADHIDPRDYHVDYDDLDATDKWLLSKLNKLIKETTMAYEDYNLTDVTNKCVDFLNNDLSNWYIRSNRRRFWESELTTSKKAVYQTTYETLCKFVLIMAPITPFVTEEIYQDLTGAKSVHLADYPTFDETLINERLEHDMDLVRDICSLGRFARDDVKIKVRQPLAAMLLDKKNEKYIKKFDSIIKEELNIKNISFIDNMSEYMNFEVKPNYREVGKIFGPKIKDFASLLLTLNHDEITSLENDNIVKNFDGKEIQITKDMVDIKIHVKEGFCSASDSKVFVILKTKLTEELILEGIAREIVRKVQSLRKDADLVITDHIITYYHGDELVNKAISKYREFIKNETLTEELIDKENVSEEFDMNNSSAEIAIKKA